LLDLGKCLSIYEKLYQQMVDSKVWALLFK
jgi:hypothetical protein